MNRPSSNPKRLHRALACASLAAAVCSFAPAPARAHFILEAPASWMSQDALGNPQKAGPCGDDSGGTPTGEVTTFAPGQTISITVNETIFHPGHYRVALAVHDRSELPDDPKVTAGSTPCGSAEIQNPPVFPVLADGELLHATSFSGPQTIQVKLPDDVTCEKCTLQIIEFMSNHGLNNPGGCYYHHCADISINAGPAPDGGTVASSSSSGGATTSSASSGAGGAGGAGGSGGDGGAGGESASSSGCGCSMPGGEAPAFAGFGSLLAVMLMARRRRK
ncbi:Hypothetical protein A7982_06689 [Minicystis rosea]|nr:Hypothetical protein A7982_06689 [Minicystis rosea]